MKIDFRELLVETLERLDRGEPVRAIVAFEHEHDGEIGVTFHGENVDPNMFSIWLGQCVEFATYMENKFNVQASKQQAH